MFGRRTKEKYQDPTVLKVAVYLVEFAGLSRVDDRMYQFAKELVTLVRFEDAVAARDVPRNWDDELSGF
jgi:hypothetical protein